MRLVCAIRLIAVLGALLCSSLARADEDTIRWEREGVSFEGSLFVPEGVGPFPCVVFVSGSGCLERSHRAVVGHSAALAARGYAVFTFDKRGCGDSTGDWREVGLEPLAEDALAGCELVRADPRVDAQRVGVMGLSQGGWIGLLMAERAPWVRWVMLLSCPPFSPAEQGEAIVEMRLRDAGWGDAQVAAGLKLERTVAEVYRTDTGWDAARSEIEDATSEAWFRDARIGVQDESSWNWRWYRTLMDHDPRPTLRAFEGPILGVYGEYDRLVPAQRSAALLRAFADEAPGERTAIVIDGVGHRLVREDGRGWPDAYWDAVLGWLERHAP